MESLKSFLKSEISKWESLLHYLHDVSKSIENISVYPNPVVDVVNITSGESIDLVRVYDLTGRIVMQANPSKQNFVLNVIY